MGRDANSGVAENGAGRRWRTRFVAAALVCAALAAGVADGGFVQRADARGHRTADAALGAVPAAQLPREAADTLNRIASGGPYPYAKDGVVFGNYERILPPHRRGYYHEYTVPTPSAHDRGARRIVCGGARTRIDDCFYTDDHYSSFRRIVE